MTGYSFFQASTLGMISQAHALGTISTNIANVSTGGFKRTETRFATVLSNNIRTTAGGVLGQSFAKQERGLGGVKVKDFQTIDQQGQIQASDRDLDLAIAGDGFFQVSPTLAVSGQILYTRDGSFQINTAGATVTALADDGSTINVSQGFLTDKNGFFVLGITPQADGTFSGAGALVPLRIDQFAFINTFSETLTADLSVNLPSATKFGDPKENISTTFIDSNGKTRAVTVNFTKTPTVNEWLMDFTGDGLTNSTSAPGGAFSLATGTGTGKILTINPTTRAISIKAEFIPAAFSPGAFLGLKKGDFITVAGATGGNNGTFKIAAISADSATITVDPSTPLPGGPETVSTAATLSSTRVVGDRLKFDANGQLTSPTSTTVNLTWSDGATNALTLDISKMSQLNGAFTLFNFSQDGLGASSLRRVSFDSVGHVIGGFEDGSSRKIYKIPLATFGNPNGLEAGNGNTFVETTNSGAARSVFADISGIAIFQNAVELSNVDLASQFTQMIQVQQAYNSSATVFKTVDEMTMVARDLKA